MSFRQTYQAVSACPAPIAHQAWELCTEKKSVSQLRLASYDVLEQYWIAVGY